MKQIHDCSAETLFPNPEVWLTLPAFYTAINRGGMFGIDTKAKVWGITDDPCNIPGCKIVLTEFVDGSPVTVRYPTRDIFRNTLISRGDV